ncbi:response regulator receiver protein [Enterobacteriaceae bacterium 89]|nr:response regulator receiver protein [Enterobacteriaceae bacterium 89]
MPSQKYEKVCCMSCHYRCELNPQPTIKVMNCIENQYCLWPDKNTYLRTGIQLSLINTHYNFVHAGFIFVDFSRYNIRLFTDSKWIEYLTKTGLRLILISDRLMQPLALYWKEKSQYIISVISTGDTQAEIEKKINFTFLGKRDARSHRNKLSDKEVTVLNLMLSEKSVKEIANLLLVTDKKIYAIRLSLQNKMGGRGRLNTIISG